MAGLKNSGLRAIEEIEGTTRMEARVFLDEIELQKNKAVDLVGIIAATGMTGGFQKTANEEKKTADFLRWVALGALLGLVGVAVWAVIASLTVENYGLAQLGAKALLTASFGILATYAARESAKHRAREQRNRRLELELQSVGPYIQDMPSEKRVEAKEKLVDRFFAQVEHRSDDEVIMSTSVVDLLQEAMRLLSKRVS